MGEMQIDLGRTQQIADKMNSFEKDLRDYSEQTAQKLRGTMERR